MTKNVLQIRTDDELMQKLVQLAERRFLPVSAMARTWVIERLNLELAKDKENAKQWRTDRLCEIKKSIDEFEEGPLQIIHLIPHVPPNKIEPASIQKCQGALQPAQRTDYSGRINRLGYITQKIYRDRSDHKMNAYLQMFTSGELESVRVLDVIDSTPQKALYGPYLDGDLIYSVSSYSATLRSLGVSPPIAVSIFFWNIADYVIRVRQEFLSFPHTAITESEFFLPEITIDSWENVDTLESCAKLLRPALNQLWNASGHPHSGSFTPDGIWRGLEQF